MARQIAKLAKGNIPYHGLHPQCMNGGWPGGRELFFFLISVNSDPLLFKTLGFFGSFTEVMIFRVL